MTLLPDGCVNSAVTLMSCSSNGLVYFAHGVRVSSNFSYAPISLAFCESLSAHTLVGGVLYRVADAPTVADANRTMEKVLAYCC